MMLLMKRFSSVVPAAATRRMKILPSFSSSSSIVEKKILHHHPHPYVGGPSSSSSSSSFTSCRCCYYSSVTSKADRIQRCLNAKQQSGLSYDELANKLGVTNTYAAQLLLGQAKLTSTTATKLQEVLPDLNQEDLKDMMESYPMRSYDDEILKEPNVYRTYEAITHYGEAMKAIINEQCGDGIMSAIDFYCDVGTTTGKHGEKRVVITFNGKFLPFIEQKADDNGAKSPRS